MSIYISARNCPRRQEIDMDNQVIVDLFYGKVIKALVVPNIFCGPTQQILRWQFKMEYKCQKICSGLEFFSNLGSNILGYGGNPCCPS